MNQTASLGTNRTGIAVAPERIQEMLGGMDEFITTTTGNEQDIAQVRIAYASQVGPLGSVPPPSGVKNALQTAVKAVTGGQPTLFMDKLGERLAFERAGVRLYEALISKHAAFGGFNGGPSLENLNDLREEEYAHFILLTGAIERLGGDPTAVTPSADIQATASLGINMLLVDPHVTLFQSLEAMLTAELIDNECWNALSQLAAMAGEEELAQQCLRAYATEQAHLEKVRAWVAAGQGREGQIDGEKEI